MTENLWFATERVSFSDYFEAALARARSPEPWRKTAADESLFRGVELLRAITLAGLSGSMVAQPSTERNPIASLSVVVGPPPPDPARAAAVRLLTTTDAIYSRGQVDTRPLETFSQGGDVGALPIPIVAGVVVVALGSLGFLGYCVHRYSEVVDHNEQRANDLAKLKEADAQALEVVKRHTEREQQAGKQLPLDEASKQALAGLSKIQELIAQKQSVDPAAPPFSFFGLSGLELGAVAAGVVGAVWLFKK